MELTSNIAGNSKINECNENEFLCRNGQCVPSSFLDERSKSYGCLDGTNESTDILTYNLQNIVGPIYKLYIIFCGKSHKKNPETRVECLYECFDYLHSAPNGCLSFLDEPKIFSSDCRSVLSCCLKIIKLFNDSNCIHICQGNICNEIIAKECSEMFFMLNTPIVFGSIYFIYTRVYLINQIKPPSASEYICSNEQLCGGFDPTKTLISFRNAICRRRQDFSTRFSLNIDDDHSLYHHIIWIRD
jgi:hypothetical protein